MLSKVDHSSRAMAFDIATVAAEFAHFEASSPSRPSYGHLMEHPGRQPELDEFREYSGVSPSSLHEETLREELFGIDLWRDALPRGAERSTLTLRPPTPARPRRGRPKGSRSSSRQGSSTHTGPCAQLRAAPDPGGARLEPGPAHRQADPAAAPPGYGLPWPPE